MVNNIKDTIVSALGEDVADDYPTYVDQVVAALTEREHEIADAAVTGAQALGLDAEQARGVVGDVGLELRPEPSPEPGSFAWATPLESESDAPDAEASVLAMLGQIKDQLGNIANLIASRR